MENLNTVNTFQAVKVQTKTICTYHVVGSLTTYVFHIRTKQLCVYESNKKVQERFVNISISQFFEGVKNSLLYAIVMTSGLN